MAASEFFKFVQLTHKNLPSVTDILAKDGVKPPRHLTPDAAHTLAIALAANADTDEELDRAVTYLMAMNATFVIIAAVRFQQRDFKS